MDKYIGKLDKYILQVRQIHSAIRPKHSSLCGAAGYEECGALVPDEDQAARLVREHVKLHIGPEGAGRIVRDHGKLL